MKYAILGAGAMGSFIGATLAKGGQEVVLVDPCFNHPEGFRTVQDITREVAAVAAAKGVTMDHDALITDMLAAVARAGEHLPSMAQDIRGKRKTEIDSLNGAISRYGRELRIPTPANDYVARFVKIIEDNYAAQF